MPTPHLNANKGDFAKTVLMPGDPLRAKFIAENFFDSYKQVNEVRGILGYTGVYKGTPLSVIASGMGMPSMAIYAHELYTYFGVENIIRVGSAGALTSDIKLRSIVVAENAITSSNIVESEGYKPETPIPANTELLRIAKSIKKPDLFFGTLRSADLFYIDQTILKKQRDNGELAVEMESAMLYALAHGLKKRALTVCAISDYALTGEGISAEERQTSFWSMIEYALEIAIKI